MKRLALVAAAALALSACQRGDMFWPRSDGVAAIKLEGISDVIAMKPAFSCDPYSDVPKIATFGGETTYLQTGMFYRGKRAGLPVHGAICYGKARPTRITVLPGQP